MSHPFDAAKKLLIPQENWPLLVEQHCRPGNWVNYTVQRFDAESIPTFDEQGLLLYSCDGAVAGKGYIEIRFALLGPRLCTQPNCGCTTKSNGHCSGGFVCADFHRLQFPMAFLSQFVQQVAHTSHSEALLSFTHPLSFAKAFPVSARMRMLLHAAATEPSEGAMGNILLNARMHELLVYGLHAVAELPAQSAFQCRFLADQSGLDRIHAAKDILLQHIGAPITIKELSKKVAINECYLKKGFKEVFGTTIFDFYQQQRMEHARYLLTDKQLSVTDVSAMLGYSSISHFSSAFKKHTGLKPCELLH